MKRRFRQILRCVQGPMFLLPSTPTGSVIQMIGVTGDNLISSATSSAEVKLLPLFRYY